jgi:hypothetical protein
MQNLIDCTTFSKDKIEFTPENPKEKRLVVQKGEMGQLTFTIDDEEEEFLFVPPKVKFSSPTSVYEKELSISF